MRTDDLRVVAYAHPVTAKILGHRERDRPFLEILNDLHHNLLAGKTGRLVNGFGGLFLGILCITGAIIWWPGIKNWKRSLKVDLGKKWKRVNWDLHSASGFWTLALIALWAVTGAYFTWDDEIKEAINYVSPLSQPNNRSPMWR
ncbi:MAG: PepSY-associated TM helix domain-containing protein [Acidobacteriota bacterium]